MFSSTTTKRLGTSSAAFGRSAAVYDRRICYAAYVLLLCCRSAVPASEQDPKTWFLLPRPEHADRLFTSATMDVNLDEFAGASLADGAASWGRAEGYYHCNMAQVQQMWQAREDFSKDLSLREVRPPPGSVWAPPTKVVSALPSNLLDVTLARHW
jgi:hypothetical protein